MIAIINYGLGNLGSVKNTLDRLGAPSVITDDKRVMNKSSAIILPGVGSALQGMKNLNDRKLIQVLVDEIKKGKPFLGICLGMQLLFSKSEEGNVKCLNIIDGRVRQFDRNKVKVPQIGWNKIKIKNSKVKSQKLKSKIKSIFNKIPDKSNFYFVNSYYCEPTDKSLIAGETEYGVNFCSILVEKNIIATQFHPEKSGLVGQQFIKNWIKKI